MKRVSRRKAFSLLEVMLALVIAGAGAVAINRIRQAAVRQDSISAETSARTTARRNIVARINAGAIGDSDCTGANFADRLSNKYANSATATTLNDFPAKERGYTQFDNLYGFRVVHIPFKDAAGWEQPMLMAYMLAWDARSTSSTDMSDLDKKNLGQLLPPDNVFPTNPALLTAPFPQSNFLRHPASQPYDQYAVIRWTTDGSTATIGSRAYPPNFRYYQWNYPRYISALRDFIFPEKFTPSAAKNWEQSWPDFSGYKPRYYEGVNFGDATGPASDMRINLFQIIGSTPILADENPVMTNWEWMLFTDPVEFPTQPQDAIPTDPSVAKDKTNYLTIQRSKFYANGTSATVNWKFIPRNPEYRSDKTINGQDVFIIEKLNDTALWDLNNQDDSTFQPTVN